MSTVSTEPSPGPGLAIVQSNRPEELRQLVIDHVRRHPLEPLEDEIILIQSRGIGRWLQLAMAEDTGDTGLGGGLGISASARFELPARFLWDAYRIVLGEKALPEDCLFDAGRLRWLVYRLIEEWAQHPGFEAIGHFLAVDRTDPRRRFQLAGVIADLFEAYQFFRADWLLDWEAGEDRLITALGQYEKVPDEQIWQPRLWRALVEATDTTNAQHRARLHRDFITELERPSASVTGLPRRIIVFGISSLPEQTLRALAALSKHSQVLVCLHNPCRWYWGNIVEARDDFRRWNDRHPVKQEMPGRALTETEVEQWANPLLASWGKQGRDFIDLLDQMDRPEDYRSWFDDRIDLFADFATGQDESLLRQLQQDIFDLKPLPAPEAREVVPKSDHSIAFTIAHSRQREVEILHDQLLAAFQADETLQPRDVIVMVPNIDDYAPHIEAVFGNLGGNDARGRRDKRYIPYTVGDRNERVRSSFMRAVETLLELPQLRFTGADVMDLLHVPGLRERFGIQESDLELAAQWLDDAGVRWGLDAEHRSELLGIEQAFAENSWQFGLNRMLLGYATGKSDDHAGILPYDEVTPATADLAARLAALIMQMKHWRLKLAAPARPLEWADHLRKLVDEFLADGGSEDAMARHQFDQALDELAAATSQAKLDEPLPLEIIRDTLLAELDRHSVSTRFLAGRVNFSTLMPMRAIPFRMVCLLGLNDGDYPRTRKPVDFDLMERFRRPGDRTRRDDDRYLFLEALLSARDRLHISWVGRSIRDNSELPPSVLVGQLQDALAAGWKLEGSQSLIDHLTTKHPLQPFSREYFRPGQQVLRTYAREWGETWQHSESIVQNVQSSSKTKPLTLHWPEGAIQLRELTEFFRQPVAYFMRRRMQVYLKNRGDIGAPPVDEPFDLDALQRWELRDELLKRLILEESDDDIEAVLDKQLQMVRLEGRLPLAESGKALARDAIEDATDIGKRYFEECDRHGPPVEGVLVDLPLKIEHPPGQLKIEDWLGDLRGTHSDAITRVQLLASKIGNKNTPRWDKLARFWPEHLAGCAMGQDLKTVLVGEDQTLGFDPVMPEVARDWLRELVECWLVGQTRPLPITPKVSGIWLKDISKADQLDEEEKATAIAKAIGKAREAYVGNRFQPGDLEREPALARLYPDFDMLIGNDDDGFKPWSQRVYGTMVRSFLLQGQK